jgi:hypothetical protein
MALLFHLEEHRMMGKTTLHMRVAREQNAQWQRQKKKALHKQKVSARGPRLLAHCYKVRREDRVQLTQPSIVPQWEAQTVRGQ